MDPDLRGFVTEPLTINEGFVSVIVPVYRSMDFNAWFYGIVVFKYCYVSWVASYMEDILGVEKGEIKIYDSFFLSRGIPLL